MTNKPLDCDEIFANVAMLCSLITVFVAVFAILVGVMK